eukprot:Seg1332.1 transcript_id=Seg1332.1/GoldUCD/mRNA.D3Y31 product="hypothetical protein" protein_id=Seg1332.1/GoldUCD/D3Y31
MNSKILLLAVILAVTLSCGYGIDNKKKESDVKSQMQNIKEEREFMRKLESKLGIKKGLPKLRDVPEEIEDALENDALPEMIENIEAHHDKAEAESNDDLDDLEAPRSNEKADASPGWPCSRRRWWGKCRRRKVFRNSSVRLNRRRRNYGKDMRH